MSIINKVLGLFLGNKYERDMKEISPYIEKIHHEFESLCGLSNDELRDQTLILRRRLKIFGV
jgi:preprotein translocase subunit SecA